jgi:hypothetical protein
MDGGKQPITDAVIKVGRNERNDIVLPHAQISNLHAQVSCLSENTFVLEDFSSNGTYVNGYRIKRAVCNRNDEVFLANLPFDLNKYFPVEKVKQELQQKFNIPVDESPDTPPKRNPNDFTSEFAELEYVYTLYNQTKRSIQGKGQLKANLFRAIPGLALTVVFASMGVPSAFTFVGGAVGSMLGLFVSDSGSIQEKLQALDDEFKINYICPKCKNFLGNIPWKNLANKKTCERCKAIWVQ